MFIRSVGQASIFTLALVALLSGCSGDSKTAEVSGMVIVDGQPAEQGSISFAPVDGNSRTAGGAIKDGKYTAPDVPIGQMRVEIRVSKITGKKQLYDDKKSEFVPTYSETLPKKFNTETELRYEVKPGKQGKDWELSTK